MAMACSSHSKNDVCIIYKRGVDENLAADLAERLEAAGLKVYYHERNCGIGEAILRKDAKAINDSEFIVLAITQSFLNCNQSDYLSQLSMSTTFKKEKWDQIIPLCFDGVTPDAVSERFPYLTPIETKCTNILDDQNAFKKLLERFKCTDEDSGWQRDAHEETSASPPVVVAAGSRGAVASLVALFQRFCSISNTPRRIQSTGLSGKAKSDAKVNKAAPALPHWKSAMAVSRWFAYWTVTFLLNFFWF
jgi:hypothetical protein